MGILLSFAPFIAFAVVHRFAGAFAGLLAGALVSAALILRDLLQLHRQPRLLEVGTCVLFSCLTVYALLADPTWSIFDVRLCVDGGLLLIVLVTLAIGRPFTLQYAREQVPESLWNSPVFFRTNQVITSAWAIAFAVLVAADGAPRFAPFVSPRISLWVTIIALVGAIKFTSWYPAHVRARTAS